MASEDLTRTLGTRQSGEDMSAFGGVCRYLCVYLCFGEYCLGIRMCSGKHVPTP